MSKTLQTVEELAATQYPLVHPDIEDYENEECALSRDAFVKGYQAANQAAQGYRDALERIAAMQTPNDEWYLTGVQIAQQALSAATTTQEECCGRCVGHCYLDKEGEHIELTSLVPSQQEEDYEIVDIGEERIKLPIKKLYAEDCADYPQQTSGWISVEDRLPEESEDVLMYFGHIYMGFYFQGKWHFAEEGESVGGLRFITHWQPLPLKPQP